MDREDIWCQVVRIMRCVVRIGLNSVLIFLERIQNYVVGVNTVNQQEVDCIH